MNELYFKAINYVAPSREVLVERVIKTLKLRMSKTRAGIVRSCLQVVAGQAFIAGYRYAKGEDE